MGTSKRWVLPFFFALIVLKSCTFNCSALSLANSKKKSFLLAKTTETFKLADLLFLEAKLQLNCERLLVDSSTGSNLFKIDTEIFQTGKERILPSSIDRCEWVAEVLAQGEDATRLISNLREASKDGRTSISDGWILDYIRMKDSSLDIHADERSNVAYTSKTLFCCLSHSLLRQPALDPSKAKERLLVIDTGERSYGKFLTRVIYEKKESLPTEKEESFARVWARRPFQYSSAINSVIAEIVIDLLLSLVRGQRSLIQGDCTTDKLSVSLLDPTCGSGTFLAVAVSRGMKVHGWDVNSQCVNGSVRNVEYVLGLDNIRDACTVHNRDAAQKLEARESKVLPHDCLVANLPWGQNTLINQETKRILENLVVSLRPGIPCAFVSKDDSLGNDLKRLGFSVLGMAHIPQQNYQLPKGKKKGNKGDTKVISNRGTSNCVVTISLSPKVNE